MNTCPETLYANGVDYVCHKSPGHSGKHRDNVLSATWKDGDTAPTWEGL
jgi:hypothetical protein